MTPLPSDGFASLSSSGSATVPEFELDPFQRQAIAAVDSGRSVLVAAPTGAGKTVVAEHAIAHALAAGRRAFYTTPVKALSNQKYADLVRRHGADQVGLLTGDNAINGDAPVVVMTTEVLRNMIYAASSQLDALDVVVLDEVHYLQDAYRGPVWEEVIIHAPPAVRLVCLSATVSNAQELADWITTVRGPTETVIETKRPIDLHNLYLVGDRTSQDLLLLPTLVDGRPNPEAERLEEQRSTRGSRPAPGRPRRRFFTPRRVEVVERLGDEDLLPAITFIFSRAACDDAVRACLDAGLRLTTADERARIRTIAEERTGALSDGDLAVLGYDRWMAGLEAGLAAHHAGMVPPFKEAVEGCFVEGLVKAVFATETLALGINMPARSVVIEKLTKFGGERHDFLTPAQYTQLTGRAGRRGIDAVGHAVVLWSPWVPFDQVAALASSRSFVLTSAFRPTYNMAANLVRRYDRDDARRLLERSFGQYQAQQSVLRLQARRTERHERLDQLEVRARCERGDVEEYRALRRAAEQAADRDRAPQDEIEEALAALRPGDVIEASGSRRGGRVVVLSVAQRRAATTRVRAISAHRRVLTLGRDDFATPPRPVGTIELPVPFSPNSREFQRRVASALHGLRARSPKSERAGRSDPATSPADAHPVARCPDRDAHLRAATQAERTGLELADLDRRIESSTGSLTRHFDRVVALLGAWGHLDGWALTERGTTLGRLYHECDLLLAEALHEGILDGLDPAALAGMVSCLTYEHRSREAPAPPWFSSPDVRRRYADLADLATDLAADEERSRLPTTRAPDPTFFALAHAWASGQPLDHVLGDHALGDTDVSGGDFVRNVKQLIDLLRQVGDVAPVPATGRAARSAAEALFRGVVAASSVVAGAEVAEAAGPAMGTA